MIGILMFAIAIFIHIALHEAGHMWMAKLFKMEVPVYSIGLGPTLFKHQTKATTYYIKAIPLGGYCDIKGLDGVDGTRSEWKQIPVILAGVVMNALIMVVSIYMLSSIYINNPKPITIMETTETSQSLGFQVGDEILELNGSTDIVGVLDDFTQMDLEFKLNRAGEEVIINVDREPLEGHMVGFSLSHGFKECVDATALTRVMLGAYMDIIPEVFSNMKESIKKTYDFNYEYKPEDGMTIVASADYIKDNSNAFGSTWYEILLNLNAMIGFSLAFFNLLPIPCLDGGRAVIILLDILTCRKIKQKYINGVIITSYTLLMVFMVITMIVEAIRL